jgi:hypothetical protein
MSNYDTAVQSGIIGLPWPKEMESLFGEGDHFITHYGFSPGPKLWNSEVYFYGRYRLTMQVTVSLDPGNARVLGNTEPPKFYLREIKSVTTEDGTLAAYFSGRWEFDSKKWKQLVQARGDWSVLGIPVKKNDPVPRFEEYVASLRAPIVKVPH